MSEYKMYKRAERRIASEKFSKDERALVLEAAKRSGLRMPTFYKNAILSFSRAILSGSASVAERVLQEVSDEQH